MKKYYKFLFLLLFGLFVFLPDDTFAATYEYFTLNQVSASGINDDLMLQPIVTTTHYGGRTFYGHSKTGNIGRTRFFLDLTNTKMEIGKKYDVNFMLFYTNVTGNTGAVPMVFFENSMCSVVSAGFYNSLKENYNFDGYIEGTGDWGDPETGYFDAWHYEFDDMYVSTTTEYDYSYLFGVKCENVTLDDLSSTTIDVYTGASDSVRATAEYSIQNAIAYDLNSNYAVQESINQTTESVKEQTEATKEQTEATKEQTEAITSDESPDISSLGDTAGWLPAGPVDSILNLPLSLFQNINNALAGSCSPITATLPFIDYPLTLPCMSTIYQKIGINSLLQWLGLIVSGFILYNYFLHLYQWVEDRLTLKEGKIEWGGN